MNLVFKTVLQMSATGSIVIIAVLIVRLLLSKAPKKYSYILWSVVAFRLVCPVSFRSAFSLLRIVTPEHGTTSMLQPEVTPNVTLLQPIAPNIAAPPAENVMPAASLNWLALLAALWCAGIAVMLCFAVVSYVRVARRMSNAMLLEENVWQSEMVRAPFVSGLIRPRIYIPFALDEITQYCVLAHERCHLHRLDHVTRLLAYLILTVHWFNPLCWIAYFLMVKDMEMSCDEAVLRKQPDCRKAYCSTLLSFAVNKRFPAPNPLAFGETGVKTRMKNILKWKKTSIWVTVAAIVICVGMIVAFAADPVETPDSDDVVTPEIGEGVASENTEVFYTCSVPEYYGTTALDGEIWNALLTAENRVTQLNIPILVCNDRTELKTLWKANILDADSAKPDGGYITSYITDPAGLFKAMNISGWETIFDQVIDRYIDQEGEALFTAEHTYELNFYSERLSLAFITGTDICGYKFIDPETGRPTESGVARIPAGTAEAIMEFASNFIWE